MHPSVNNLLSQRFVIILFCVFNATPAFAQQFKLTQGIAITEFIYQNEQGQNVQGLKSGSGLAFGLAFHKASLVDSAKYKLDQTPFAIYLGQNPKIAKLLSLINYDLGLHFTQLINGTISIMIKFELKCALLFECGNTFFLISDEFVHFI